MSKLKEVALKAGVSEATVSRVLSQDKLFSVSADTRKKIMQAASELNYAPRKKTNGARRKSRIYLVHQPTGKELAGDTFYVEIKSNLEIEGDRRGFEMVNVNNLAQIKKRDMALAEGLIGIGKFTDREMNKLHSLATSLVFLDAHLSHYDTVNLEAESAVIAILDYLVALNHKRIAFLGAKNEADPTAQEERTKYVYEYLKARNMLIPEFIQIGNFDVHSGYTLTKELLRLNVRPSALFLIDDKLAIGAFRAIREAGLRIPEDISVIGYSDFPLSKYLVPALTTYRVEFEKMSDKAFDLLLEQWNGRIMSKREYVTGSIVMRESTGPAADSKIEL